MFDVLLSVIAPHHCCNCGKLGRLLCDDCKKCITSSRFDRCVLCRKKVKSNNICVKHNVIYDHIWCITYREGVIAKLIDDYKFHRVKSAAADLTEIIDIFLPELPCDAVLVPIPTAPRNIRQRGYDHILLIVKKLAKRRQVNYACLLARRTNTVQHFAKTVKERQKNAKTFFEIHGDVDSKARYIIVDDIFTTGSTINAAAKVLRQAGAKYIDVVIIARHDMHHS